jgi:hypothetical protein
MVETTTAKSITVLNRAVIHHGTELPVAERQALGVLTDFAARRTEGAVTTSATLDAPHMLVIGERPAIDLDNLLAGVAHDGYVLWPGAAGLVLAAHSAKGLLNAVYGYLAWAGVLWPAPGEEVVPPGHGLPCPAAPITRTPAFSRRGIFHCVRNDWTQWCEWYARLGFNEVSLDAGSGAWSEIREVADRFGMMLQVGGHVLSQLVPRELFAEYPDYFRALQPPDFDRTRSPDTNFCPGNVNTLDILRQNARRFALDYPGVRVLHLWADDLPAGGWCCCARCMGLTPQDQAILTSNAVAEGVCQADAQINTAHLIYHDTLEPPRLAKPHPSLEPLYAPRERCYGHALNDPACARNRYFVDNLQQVLEYFNHRDWTLFEYYSDYILFRAMLPLMPEVIADDLAYYRTNGLDCAMHLLVGTVVGVLLNMHVFAQQTWDLDADPWEPLRRLAQGVPGLLEAWQLRAQASTRWLSICDWPLDRCFDYRFLLERPAAEAEAYRREVRRAADELDQAVSLLPETLPSWAERERLSLKTSAAICRQMESQMAMLQALGACVAGDDRRADAQAAYHTTLQHGKTIGALFTQAGLTEAYFFALESLLEEIWREKVE